MQHYLNNRAIYQVASAAVSSGARKHRHSEEYVKLVVALASHYKYLKARMPL
jgi:hypothetical protein